MIRFADGPAADKCLALRRTPLFLRVVHSKRGWDALDQLADTPGMDEAIHVYMLMAQEGGAFICGRRFGGYFPMATYRHYDHQPPDDVARGIRSWQDWCRAEANKLGLKGAPATEEGRMPKGGTT